MPTCALTPNGYFIAANEAFARMFTTGRPPANLCDEARDILLGRDRRWAPPLMAEPNLARCRYPDDSSLRRLRGRFIPLFHPGIRG
jgi:hypothetical protein